MDVWTVLLFVLYCIILLSLRIVAYNRRTPRTGILRSTCDTFACVTVHSAINIYLFIANLRVISQKWPQEHEDTHTHTQPLVNSEDGQ